LLETPFVAGGPELYVLLKEFRILSLMYGSWLEIADMFQLHYNSSIQLVRGRKALNVRRSALAGVSVLCVAVAASSLAGEPSQKPTQGSPTTDWDKDRETEWDSILAGAGKPIDGRYASATVEENPARAGSPIDMILRTKNVGDHVIRFNIDRGSVPLVLVRDAKGKPVRRTAEGMQEFGPDRLFYHSSGSYYNAELAPGKTEERVIRLTDLYVLDAPGVYTVLAEGPVRGVAKPVTLRIVERNSGVDKNSPATPTKR
jgi:hypothetical protein